MCTSGSAAPGVRRSSSRTTSSRSSAGTGACPRTSTDVAVTSPASAVRRRASRSSSTNTTLLPESSRANTISSVCHQAFIGTAMAPTEVMAANAAIHSGWFRIAIATRSPCCTPRSWTSACPIRPTRSSTLVIGHRSSSYTMKSSVRVAARAYRSRRLSGVPAKTLVGCPRTSVSTISKGVSGAHTAAHASWKLIAMVSSYHILRPPIAAVGRRWVGGGWECGSQRRRCSAVDVGAPGKELADSGLLARAVVVGAAHVHGHAGSAEFERDLEAGAAGPGHVLLRARRHEGECRRSAAVCDGGEEGDPLGAHGETERHVLDDHPRGRGAVGRHHGGAGAELGVRGMGERAGGSRRGDQLLRRGWSHRPGLPRSAVSGRRLVQFDAVPRGVVEERLEARADGGGLGDVDPPATEFGHGRREVGDPDGEVLTLVVGNVRFDEVHLLVAEIEPGATDGEVGPVAPDGQAEHVGVEADRLVGVGDVDRHVVDREWLHPSSLADTPLLRVRRDGQVPQKVRYRPKSAGAGSV